MTRDSGKSAKAQAAESQRVRSQAVDGFDPRRTLVPGSVFPLSGGATVRTTATTGSQNTGAAFGR